MFRTSPRVFALACVALLGAGVIGAAAARAAECRGQLQLEAEYYATPIAGVATCVAAGDWNDDGRADLAVVHLGSTLTTLLGMGAYRVGSRRAMALDITPQWVVAHDMNGDGHQDLIATGERGTLVLAGDGAGGFREIERFPAPGIRAAVGDLDGDGVPDIVLASAAPALTVLFRGTGEVLELSGGAYSAVLADFDHDGDLDLASTGTLIWLNDGHGHLSGPTSYLNRYCSPSDIAAGDLNGDGNVDLFGMVGGRGGDDCDMLLLGNGDGTFQSATPAALPRSVTRPAAMRPAATIESASEPQAGELPRGMPESPRHVPQGPHFVVLVDLDGDGIDEPVRIGRERGHELNGRRSLPEANVACAADMDQDGRLDVVVAGYGAIATHPGNGDGSFRFNPSAWTRFRPYDVQMADLDGDGRRDVAMTSVEDELVVALTAADGTFKRIISDAIYPGGGRIQLADFDGDGRVDLLDVYDGVYRGNGDGTFRTPPIGDVPFGIAGDYDEDGHVDLASALIDRVRLSFGNGDGTFRTGPDIVVPAQEIRALDVDHDGHVDLVATARMSASVVYGRGDGTAAEIVGIPVQGWLPGLSWGDFDGDGSMDVVAPTTSGVAVFLGRGRTFVRSADTDAPAGAAVGDLNGDGFADLMAGGVWFGHGDGTFERDEAIYGPGGSTYLDDRNGDGLADVVVAGSYDEDDYENTLTLIPNRTTRNRPPVTANARAVVGRAWPPNGGFADVAISGITDPDGDAVTIACLGVTQDEPVSGGPGAPAPRGSGKRANDCADAVIVPGGYASVRLARDGSGNGRVYDIAYRASDGCGGSSLGSVRICVPHDPDGDCVDDGQRFNSLACGSSFTAQATDDGSQPLAIRALGAGRWSIRYSLSAPAEIRLEVFDLSGRRVAMLESGRRGSGGHESVWAPATRNGVFFVRLTGNGQPLIRRCIVLE